MSGWCPPTIFRLLQGVASAVIVMWGIRAASHLLVLIAVALLLARPSFRCPSGSCTISAFARQQQMALTVTLLGTLNVVTLC
jgi:hypothetical protein